LTSIGYSIKKDKFKFKKLLNSTRELNVSPFIRSGYGPARPKSYPVYKESETKLYLPRHYGLQNYGDTEVKDLTLGIPINLKFKGKLRPIQEKSVAAFMETIGPDNKSFPSRKFSHGGILSLPCGFGKTILSLYLISLIGKKTIICVHKEFLMHQWHERIQQFLPGAKVGIIQQKKVDVVNKDIVIAMVQSLALRDYDKKILDQFGMVIFDECHHLSSEVFCRCLPKISARITLGLSATPTRSDGLTKVFKWFLGDILFRTKRKKDNIDKTVRCITLDSEKAGYGKEIRVQWTGNLNSAAMLNKIAEHEPRTSLIAELAKAIIHNNNKRQILILSGRRSHLDALYDIIAKTQIPIGYYVGGMNQDSLKESEKCKIILATYNMAAEGLDIKSLNTLLLATPMSNVVQAVGRILRVVDKNLPPMIVDIIDDFSSFSKQSLKRKKIYKSQGFNKVISMTPNSENWCDEIPRFLKKQNTNITCIKSEDKSYLFDSDSE